MPEFERIEIDRFRSGERLYGDDFDLQAINAWYEAEKSGFYDLVQGERRFSYGALNQFHFADRLERHYPQCLAFGCADGTDVEAIAPHVGRFIAIEPAREWWRDEIGGKPAAYLMPQPDGALDLPDESVNIVTCFGVLHHIPNVSAVLAEIARVLKRDGLLLVREPSSSMGDWRRVRRGLTRNERGISREWMLSRTSLLDFECVSVRPCLSPLTARLARLFGEVAPFTSRFWVRVDVALAKACAPFDRYWRESWLEKLAAGSHAYIFRRR
jgi:SAM-dependent methyltransferase